MTSQRSVEAFLNQDRLAVVGVSAKGQGFGAMAYKTLKEKGLDLVPVHPTAEEIAGDKAFRSLKEVPRDVGGALIIVPPEQTEQVVKDAAEAGIRHLWMQQGAESEAAIEFCQQNDIDAVHGECIMMFADPSGLHRFHRWIWGVIGKLPQESPEPSRSSA